MNVHGYLFTCNSTTLPANCWQRVYTTQFQRAKEIVSNKCQVLNGQCLHHHHQQFVAPCTGWSAHDASFGTRSLRVMFSLANF